MKDLRCLLGSHKWTKTRDAEMETVAVCSRCGKEVRNPQPPPGAPYDGTI